MILSFSKQFIFIKTRKTGGTSIEKYLSKFLKNDDIYTKHDGPKHKNHYDGMYNHIGVSEFLKTKYGDCWNNFITITAVRHPMDKIISRFYWDDKDGRYSGDFDIFLRDANRMRKLDNHWIIGGYDFDFIIYYENYINDINKVLKYLNLPTVKQEDFPKFKTGFRKDMRPWHEFMRKDQIEYIKQKFPEEIELHKKLGYKI